MDRRGSKVDQVDSMVLTLVVLLQAVESGEWSKADTDRTRVTLE